MDFEPIEKFSIFFFNVEHIHRPINQFNTKTEDYCHRPEYYY